MSIFSLLLFTIFAGFFDFAALVSLPVFEEVVTGAGAGGASPSANAIVIFDIKNSTTNNLIRMTAPPISFALQRFQHIT
jgi:hypothetical protein